MKLISIFVVFIISVFSAWTKEFTFEDIVHNIINQDRYIDVSLPAEDNIFRFMVFGDFGNVPTYFKIGRTADTMNELAKKSHQEHIITVGDNFYPHGLKYTWFRLIPWIWMSQFKKNALKDIKIYPTLGNHDWYSNMYNEIEFSKYDSQWTFEKDYYVLKNELKDGSGKFFVNIVLNSCKTLCPVEGEFPDEDGECSNFTIKAGGPEVQAHYAWIIEQLEKYSNNPEVAWLTVSLHHPPFQNRGEKNHLLPLLRKYKIDAIFAGHEHWIEFSNMDPDYHIRYPTQDYGPIVWNCSVSEIIKVDSRTINYAKGQKLHQFTVGNGGTNLQPSCPLSDQDGDVIFRNTEDYGSLQIEATAEKMTAIVYNYGLLEKFRVNIYSNRNHEKLISDSL